MYDSAYFAQMQEDYYKLNSKSVSLESSQVLFTCFHPVFGEGDYLLMLEKVNQPEDVAIRHLKFPSKLTDLQESYSKAAQNLFKNIRDSGT